MDPTIVPAKHFSPLYDQNPSKLTPTTLPPHDPDDRQTYPDGGQQSGLKTCKFPDADQQASTKPTRIHISPVTNRTADEKARRITEPVGSKSAGERMPRQKQAEGREAGQGAPPTIPPGGRGIVADSGAGLSSRGRNPNREGNGEAKRSCSGVGVPSASPQIRFALAGSPRPRPPVGWRGEERVLVLRRWLLPPPPPPPPLSPPPN